MKIFVFGSNLAGRHGKGAALWARQNRGAVYGQGKGLQGHSYAIPTRDGRRAGPITENLPLDEIERYICEFVAFAASRPDLEFEVTAIGCGLAGYKPEQIAPMFGGAPNNVHLPAEFNKWWGR